VVDILGVPWLNTYMNTNHTTCTCPGPLNPADWKHCSRCGLEIVEPEPDTRCHSCKVEAAVLNGTASMQDRHHWSLWGCTCDPADEAEAVAWMDRVTR
jgi:hypothetical protein